MNRVEAIYARQSIEKKDSLSIEQQIERCKKKADNPERCEIYQESKSGKDTIHRDQFNRMMEGVRAGRISKIIVYRLDRISRSLADFAKMWEELNTYGVQFVSCTEDFDTSTPMGDAMLKIAMVFAEMERKIIVQRVTDSYFALARKGFFMGGPTPFGFTKVQYLIDGKRTKAFQADPACKDVILQMFTQYATSDVSIGALARQCKEQGIQSARGTFFTSSSIGRILRHPVYVKADERVYAYFKSKGAAIYNPIEDFCGINGCYLYAPQQPYSKDAKKKRSGRKFSDLSNTQVIIAPHEGIVPAGIWLACQDKLDRNRQVPCVQRGKHTWMSGLMKCANCRLGVTVVNNNRGRNYINCYGRKKHQCRGRSYPWRLDEIESAAELQLFHRLHQLKTVSPIEIDLPESQGVSELRTQIIKIEEQMDKIEHEILLATSDSIQARWRQKQAALQMQLDECCAKLAELQSARNIKNQTFHPNVDVNFILHNWQTLELDTKKRIARTLIDFILVGDKREDGVQVFFK